MSWLGAQYNFRYFCNLLFTLFINFCISTAITTCLHMYCYMLDSQFNHTLCYSHDCGYWCQSANGKYCTNFLYLDIAGHKECELGLDVLSKMDRVRVRFGCIVTDESSASSVWMHCHRWIEYKFGLSEVPLNYLNEVVTYFIHKCVYLIWCNIMIGNQYREV